MLGKAENVDLLDIDFEDKYAVDNHGRIIEENEIKVVFIGFRIIALKRTDIKNKNREIEKAIDRRVTIVVEKAVSKLEQAKQFIKSGGIFDISYHEDQLKEVIGFTRYDVELHIDGDNLVIPKFNKKGTLTDDGIEEITD